MCNIFEEIEETEVTRISPGSVNEFQTRGYISEGQEIITDYNNNVGNSYINVLHNVYDRNDVECISDVTYADLTKKVLVFESGIDINKETLNVIDVNRIDNTDINSIVRYGLPKKDVECLVGKKRDDDETSLYNFFDNISNYYKGKTFSFYKSGSCLTQNGIPMTIEFMGVYALHVTESAIQKRLVFEKQSDIDYFN